MYRVNKSNVTASFLMFIGVLLMTHWTTALAAQKGAVTVKFRIVNNTAKIEMTHSDKEARHYVGNYERRGLGFHENGDIVTTLGRGKFDSKKGITSYEYQETQTFEDGSTQVMKLQGESKPAPGGKGRLSGGTFEYVEGTGRFVGIKGNGSFKGKFPTYTKESKGYAYFDFTGTYTLPSK